MQGCVGRGSGGPEGDEGGEVGFFGCEEERGGHGEEVIDGGW